MTRKNILRGGDWIKNWWGTLRTLLTTLFADFERSGKNEAEGDVEWMSEHETSRFVYHSSNRSRKYPEVTRYAYGVLELSDFASLGKELPPNAGRDDSLTVDSRDGHPKRGRGISTSEDESGSIAKAITSQGTKETQNAALRTIMEFGNAEDKAAAMQQLKKLAGL